MSISIISGRLLNVGSRIYFDSARDLSGTVERKTDRQFEVQWDGGNRVWYPLHESFVLQHQRKAS